MTNESRTVAVQLDQFPEDIRIEIMESTLRLIDAYAAVTMKDLAVLRDACDPLLKTAFGGAQVIPLFRRRVAR